MSPIEERRLYWAYLSTQAWSLMWAISNAQARGDAVGHHVLLAQVTADKATEAWADLMDIPVRHIEDLYGINEEAREYLTMRVTELDPLLERIREASNGTTTEVHSTPTNPRRRGDLGRGSSGTEGAPDGVGAPR